MDWELHFATIVMALVGGTVGLKLLSRARRERQLADFSVALGLFCYATMAQAGRFLSLAIDPDISPMLEFSAVSYRVVGFFLTLAGLSVFNWRVFGPDSRWRRVVCAAVVTSGFCGSVAILYSSWLKAHGAEVLSSLWQLPISFAFLTAFVWTAAESLRYYGLMRRRQALGLADPAVTNRFFIWGAGAALSTVLTLVTVAMTFAGQSNGTISRVATTSAGLVNAVVWWLSFMPPSAYLAWLSRRSETGSGVSTRGADA